MQQTAIGLEPRPTADRREVEKFDALAARWWDRRGPMGPLHAMNPARSAWIMHHMRANRGEPAPRVLDVGCGAGLLAESLARAGCRVTGIDAAGEAIAAARAHAVQSGLTIEYRAAETAELIAEGQRFPVITALEVIEHVPDPQAFMVSLASLLEPGGMLFISTINRTARSFAVAKLGAEYLLGLLPRGTHDWARFITPGELALLGRNAGLRFDDVAGLVPRLLEGGFRTSRAVSVNYIALARN